MTPLVKICGITNVGDARCAFDLGADWIGLNLVGGPRRIELRIAEGIAASIEDASRAVALIELDDETGDESLLGSLWACGIRLLQVYGRVSARRRALSPFGLIHVRHVTGSGSLDNLSGSAGGDDPAPDYILLDAHLAGAKGGTGRQIDWQLLASRLAGAGGKTPPLILAGGLTPQNVAGAIRLIRPHGVDVSSGVEQSPGRKDPAKVRDFIAAVRSAGAE